jgi:hypothetical protein
MKHPFLSRRLAARAALAAVFALAFHATASAAGKDTPEPAGAAGVVSAPVAQVEGFRSARFGMTEAMVKEAIAKDFGLKAADIKSQSNAGERTHVLSIKVPDVLPGGGIGEVTYVFGYKTKKLIQVSVAWSKATDPKMTPEQLYSNSSVLRAHFLAEGYRRESIASNMPINGGLLVFRGSDAKDRTTMLILQGTMAAGKDNAHVLTPTALLLFYIEDAKAPDIYKLPPGSF